MTWTRPPGLLPWQHKRWWWRHLDGGTSFMSALQTSACEETLATYDSLRYIPIRPSWSLIGRLVVGIWFWMVELNFGMRVSNITVWNKVCYRPLCWTHKFRNLYRDATQNTPTSDSKSFSSCSLESQVCRILRAQNRRFTYWIKEEFRSSNGWQIPLVVDFEPLGALLSPGAQDADLAPFRKRFFELDRNTNSQKPYFRNADRTFGCLHLSLISQKAL